MAITPEMEFFNKVKSWAEQNGFPTYDEASKSFKSTSGMMTVDQIVQAMTNEKKMAESRQYLEEGYSLDNNGVLRKSGRFVSPSDPVARDIQAKIEAKRKLIDSSAQIEKLAVGMGWKRDTKGNFKSPANDIVSLEEMKLLLLDAGMFRTDREIVHDNRTSVLTELDKIKNASLKDDPQLSAQAQAIESKLKSERRKRIRSLAGAVIGVGIVAASGGLLAPVAAGLAAGTVAAGSAIGTLGLTGAGILAGTGIAAGFGTNYAIKAYEYIKDPTKYAARVSNKLSKHMLKVHELEERFAKNPSPSVRRQLEAKLKKENEYAAKQAAKAAKKREKFEKKAENSFAEKLFGYSGFADVNSRRAELYGQISDVLEQDINNNVKIANEYGLDLAKTRGKSAQIINKAHTKTEALSTLDNSFDMENVDMVSKMMDDYIQANSDLVVELGTNGGVKAVIDKMIENHVITKDFAYNGDTLKVPLTEQVSLKSLVACKYANNFDLQNDKMTEFMNNCVKNSTNLINEKDMEKMNMKERDLIGQIYGKTILNKGDTLAYDDQTTGTWTIDHVDRVREMQHYAMGGTTGFMYGGMTEETTPEYQKRQATVAKFEQEHKFTTKVAQGVQKVAKNLGLSDTPSGPSPTGA